MIAGKCKIILAVSGFLFITGCSSSLRSFNPEKKFSKEVLQKDYLVFRRVLEEGHPSLYWYTSKDSMDNYFDTGYSRIGDSMTEAGFRTLLSYVVAKINCGHTTVRSSKKYAKYMQKYRSKQFPLSIKFWKDSAVVYANLNRYDSILTKGTIVKTLNGRDISFYRDSLFQFISMDGHGINHKYQTLSNYGGFGGWFRNVFGLSDQFRIGYVDSSGEEKSTVISLYDFKKDTAAPFEELNLKPPRHKVKSNPRQADRSLLIDSSGHTAIFTLNTFLRGNNLSGFVRKTFRTLKRKHVENLVLDVRSNGGGNVGISNLLTKYLIDHPFKLADSLYAINKKSRYGRYIGNYFWNHLFMNVISRKREDGKYHFGYFERHYFNPKKKNHFNGNVYLVTGGNSFSATSLFATVVKGQKNVTVVGEETGGGAYGNTAWLIPDVTLPNTKLRFRLPRFRMVVNKNMVKNGRGVMPDVPVGASLQSIRQGIDPKIEKVKELIALKSKESVR